MDLAVGGIRSIAARKIPYTRAEPQKNEFSDPENTASLRGPAFMHGVRDEGAGVY